MPAVKLDRSTVIVWGYLKTLFKSNALYEKNSINQFCRGMLFLLVDAILDKSLFCIKIMIHITGQIYANYLNSNEDK